MGLRPKTYGEIVAARYKRQYFRKRKGWMELENWDMQPEQIHTILIELKSKAAIEALIGNNSWTKRLPRRP